jgi:hypothetical protein
MAGLLLLLSRTLADVTGLGPYSQVASRLPPEAQRGIAPVVRGGEPGLVRDRTLR